VHLSKLFTFIIYVSCQNIDGTLRLYEDLEVVCYTSTHNAFAFGIALPGLIIWGLGIPSLGLALLLKYKDSLNTGDVRLKYGFLYKGYNERKAFYWEIVIMYRKIIFIFIRVFMS
jgi:hypothetical protein